MMGFSLEKGKDNALQTEYFKMDHLTETQHEVHEKGTSCLK